MRLSLFSSFLSPETASFFSLLSSPPLLSELGERSLDGYLSVDPDVLRSLGIFVPEKHPSYLFTSAKGVSKEVNTSVGSEEYSSLLPVKLFFDAPPPPHQGLSVRGLLDTCSTRPGSRLLGAWMRKPRVEASGLSQRFDALDLLTDAEHADVAGSLVTALKGVAKADTRPRVASLACVADAAPVGTKVPLFSFVSSSFLRFFFLLSTPHTARSAKVWRALTRGVAALLVVRGALVDAVEASKSSAPARASGIRDGDGGSGGGDGRDGGDGRGGAAPKPLSAPDGDGLGSARLFARLAAAIDDPPLRHLHNLSARRVPRASRACVY